MRSKQISANITCHNKDKKKREETEQLFSVFVFYLKQTPGKEDMQ